MQTTSTNALKASSNKPPTNNKIRLLCLHGFWTSGKILKQQLQLANWQDKFGDLVEFEFLTAPHKATGKIPEDVSFPGPYFEWWNAKKIDDEIVYQGVEQSLDYIEQYLAQNGPFDGFLGFSMGAAVATLILMLKQKGKRFQQFNFQVCVCIAAGIRPRDKTYGDMFMEDDVLEIPSAHIIGDKDLYRIYSISLSKLYNSRILMQHQRGHRVPVLNDEQLQQMREFLIKNGMFECNSSKL
eukprot:TRINITY_DN7693_c0_g1_i2.p3 TRINITY_DN7693_c0_g1~~TRINITY_DN7693_c0_g1_i2.p3  ORF type:complete len:240 (+),score=30.90 TRINITY_DN7693_c0_g1_i2:151-870(+)